MYVVTLSLQLFLVTTLLLAAIVATFRPRWLQVPTTIFSKSKLARVIQSTGFWTGGLIIMAGIAVPFLVFFGACIAFVSSIPLAINAILLKNTRAWVLPAFLAIGAIAVAFAQPLGLKVLALPKADDLPFIPVQIQVIKTYDEGLCFEGIAVGEDGTLYLSGNRGLDFSRGDYYHAAQGELIARKSDGSERIIFKTPTGLTSGVPIVAPNNSIYLTSHGETSYIWHIDSAGNASKLATLPPGAWPNGLDMGPDGMLYSPDSNLGLIWRIDPKTGTFSAAVRDKSLLARTFVSLAPGANGLHFKGQDMIVTVSDRTTVLKYTLNQQGKFGSAALVATGIPGDDFAIGKDGSLFVTTHPYNTLVRVSPGGERTIIGKEAQHIIGATDAAFGKTATDSNTLYVVTDGGAFTGGPNTRGELVAVHPYQK